MLASSDVCVNPDEANRMNDISTMNKVLEYMALGKPIVQFDLHEGRVSAGDASLYAKRNDATSLAERIVQLVDDAETRAWLGQIGVQRLTSSLCSAGSCRSRNSLLPIPELSANSLAGSSLVFSLSEAAAADRRSVFVRRRAADPLYSPALRLGAYVRSERRYRRFAAAAGPCRGQAAWSASGCGRELRPT